MAYTTKTYKGITLLDPEPPVGSGGAMMQNNMRICANVLNAYPEGVVLQTITTTNDTPTIIYTFAADAGKVYHLEIMIQGFNPLGSDYDCDTEVLRRCVVCTPQGVSTMFNVGLALAGGNSKVSTTVRGGGSNLIDISVSGNSGENWNWNGVVEWINT